MTRYVTSSAADRLLRDGKVISVDEFDVYGLWTYEFVVEREGVTVVAWMPEMGSLVRYRERVIVSGRDLPEMSEKEGVKRIPVPITNTTFPDRSPDQKRATRRVEEGYRNYWGLKPFQPGDHEDNRYVRAENGA